MLIRPHVIKDLMARLYVRRGASGVRDGDRDEPS